jgi:hypothetical protein
MLEWDGRMGISRPENAARLPLAGQPRGVAHMIEGMVIAAFALGIAAGAAITAGLMTGRSAGRAAAEVGSAVEPVQQAAMCPGADAVPRDTWVDAAPVSFDRAHDATPTPRRLADAALKPAAEHAAALLAFLQGPGGATGELTAADVEAAYTDLMIDLGWMPRPWSTVATALRVALGGAAKTYAWRAGRRVRVYHIPPAVVAQVAKRRALATITENQPLAHAA